MHIISARKLSEAIISSTCEASGLRKPNLLGGAQTWNGTTVETEADSVAEKKNELRVRLRMIYDHRVTPVYEIWKKVVLLQTEALNASGCAKAMQKR